MAATELEPGHEADAEDRPVFPVAGGTAWVIRYAKNDIRPQGIPADDLARIKQALHQLPGAMHGELTTLDIKGPLESVRGVKAYRLRVGDWRVIYTSEPDGVTVFTIDRRQDDTYTRSDRMAVVRRGRGVAFVESVPRAADPAPHPDTPARPPTFARRQEQQNPLTPFEHSQLEALGLAGEVIELVRTFPDGVVLADELAALGVDVDAVELVSDAWSDPARYLEIFAGGRTPTLADARISDAELAERLAHPDSAESVATLGADGLDAILAQDIEQWMFYLHPSQARIVTIAPTGPSRIRGGPGTGKTVAALHRARYLVEVGTAERVLLTTFVSALPPVWDGLLAQFAPNAASSVTSRTMDSLALEIVKTADGPQEPLQGDPRRVAINAALERVPLAKRALGGTMQLEEEIDRVIAGRGIRTLEEYLATSRRGRGLRLDMTQREAVWQAYERYSHKLQRDGDIDWAHLRLRALELALDGQGPRFDAVIIDEAQDITEVGVRLLMALDAHPDHAGFLLVGDGQQSIYPGGFSLRSVGLDVRGRSFVLRTNWRNTDAVMQAAKLALGQHTVPDLGDDLDLSADSKAVPRRVGQAPRLHLAESCAPDAVLVEVVRDLIERVPPGDVAVLSRTNKLVNAAEQALRDANVPVTKLRGYAGTHSDSVRCGTFAYSKGLEFKAVVLFGIDADSWAVNPFWLHDTEDIKEWWANERRTLFVAMTRARDALDLIGGAQLGRPLDDARAACDEWPW